MKAFVVLLCCALFALTLASGVSRDNTREEPNEEPINKEEVAEGEKDPKDQEKFLFGPLLNLLTGFGKGQGHGGLGGLGGGFGHHHHYPPPHYGYPPYGPYGHYRPPYGGYY